MVNGQVYIGQWKQDLRDGRGKYFWPDKNRYQGEFK